MTKPRLILVFLALVVSYSAAAADVDSRDPGKLKLASANAVVIDASAHRPVYAKGADEVTPIASLTKLMTAIVTLDAQPGDGRVDRDRHGGLRLPQGLALAAAHGRHASPARDAAPRADVVGEPRGVRAGAQLSGRHRSLRPRDERKGARARHDQDELRRPDRPFGPQRVDGERPRDARRRSGRIPRDTRVQHHAGATSSRCSRQVRCWDFDNTNGLVKNSGWNIHLSKTG